MAGFETHHYDLVPGAEDLPRDAYEFAQDLAERAVGATATLEGGAESSPSASERTVTKPLTNFMREEDPIAGDHRFGVPTVRPVPRPPVLVAPDVW